MKKPFTSLAVFFAAASAWSQCLTLVCPGNLTNQCAGPQGTVVNFTVTPVSTCGGAILVNCSPPSGSLFPVGTTTVNCMAQSSENQFAFCSFTVTVRDTIPPLISHPLQVQAACTGPAGAFVNFEVTATDDCSTNVTLQCTPPSGSFFPVGTTIVNCTAVDGAGNRSVAVFPVTVSGGCANCIELYCPTAPIVLNTGFGSTAKTNFAVTATNTCVRDIELEVTSDPPPNTALPVGTNIVKCSASDGAGSFRECEFTIIVRDNSYPYLAVRPVVETECKGRSPQGVPGAQVWYPPVIVTDNADPKPTVTFVPANGSTFPLGTNSVTCTATDKSGNQTVKTFLVVVKPGSKCGEVSDPELTLAPDNWGFELGNLTGWAESGDAFSDQPLIGDRITVKRMPELSLQMSNSIGGDYWHDVTYQIGFKGRYWVGSGDSPADIFSTDTGGPANETRTGTLLSKQFTVEKNFVTFLISGQDDLDKLRVEFLVQTDQPGPDTVRLGSYDYRVVFVDTGHNSEALRRDNFPLQAWIGSKARIRIVDNSTTGHINVDDFQFQDSAPLLTTVNVAGTNIVSVNYVEGKFYDWDAPLWGFADMHTHPMSYLGFGGKIMHGKLDGAIYDALGDCNCDHGGYDFIDNQCGDYYRQLLTTVMDDKGYNPHRGGYVFDTWKNFRSWPVFSTITHQQMWYEWLRRAYNGGERVIVALCVNSPVLGHVSKGHLRYDDLSVGTNQINAMKAFVARHSDFMEIAYDPFQLRDIVRGNRLAVILGSELDDIGNLCQDPLVHASADAFSKQRVTEEIDRLYNLGLRYIFPVHLEDNKFGGTALGDDMLNLGNKYLNGVPFSAEPSPQAEGLTFRLEHLDFTEEAVGLNIAAVAFGPLLPNVASPIVEAFAGPQAPGSGAAISFGLLPIALIGGFNEIVLNAIGVEPLPPSIWPVGNNFPDYGKPAWGHRNTRGLTPLGEFALREFMKRGIMIDIDHMGHHTITNVLARAEAAPGGYPLNSGHNSFRVIQIHPGENSRTPEQLIRIRDLGGIMGVGYENGDTWSRHIGIDEPSPVTSEVENDCAGTSKSFAQNYLYALERLGGKQIAFGTDINGLIPGPGPRFGPQSAFGLEFQAEDRRVDQIGDQRNGVLYEPKYGRPLTTPAFIGPGMDPDKTEEKPRSDKGYRYNKEQASYFAALRVFFWKKHITENELNRIVDAMHDNYPDKDRIKELTRGLVKANVGQGGGSDTEKIAGAVYRKQVLDIDCPQEIITDQNKYSRYGRLSRVWHDYQNNFGNNTPMKRCNTSYKEWDLNFEGVAHYGLLPDLLQDLSNVNLQPIDMSPLFQSAEDFAQMWTRSLTTAYNINHPTLQIVPDLINHGSLTVRWYGEDGDVLEETTNLSSGNWQASSASVQTVNGHKVAVFQVNPNTPQKFYRVRKL